MPKTVFDMASVTNIYWIYGLVTLLRRGSEKNRSTRSRLWDSEQWRSKMEVTRTSLCGYSNHLVTSDQLMMQERKWTIAVLILSVGERWNQDHSLSHVGRDTSSTAAGRKQSRWRQKLARQASRLDGGRWGFCFLHEVGEEIISWNRSVGKEQGRGGEQECRKGVGKGAYLRGMAQPQWSPSSSLDRQPSAPRFSV